MGGSEAFAMVKTTKITVETESLTIVRRARIALAWCPDCHGEVEVIALDTHDTGEGISSAQLDRWIATDKLHIWQPAIGQAQICLTSLLRCFNPQEVQKMEIKKERT